MYAIIAVAVFGTLCSAFLGWRAPGIFSFEGRDPHYRRDDEPEKDEKTGEKRPKKPGWSWILFQFWLHFICSVIGWAIAIHFLHRLLVDSSGFKFTVDDAIPMLIALLGITGLLPRTLFFGKVPWKIE